MSAAPTRNLRVTIGGRITVLTALQGAHLVVGDRSEPARTLELGERDRPVWCTVTVHAPESVPVGAGLSPRRGPRGKLPADRREERFDVRLTPSEAAAVRAAAGGEAVGVWLRGLVLRELNATHPTILDILAPLLEDLVRHEGDPVVWAPDVKASDVRAELEQGNRATQAAAAALLRAAVRRYVRERSGEAS